MFFLLFCILNSPMKFPFITILDFYIYIVSWSLFGGRHVAQSASKRQTHRPHSLTSPCYQSKLFYTRQTATAIKFLFSN